MATPHFRLFGHGSKHHHERQNRRRLISSHKRCFVREYDGTVFHDLLQSSNGPWASWTHRQPCGSDALFDAPGKPHTHRHGLHRHMSCDPHLKSPLPSIFLHSRSFSLSALKRPGTARLLIGRETSDARKTTKAFWTGCAGGLIDSRTIAGRTSSHDGCT